MVWNSVVNPMNHRATGVKDTKNFHTLMENIFPQPLPRCPARDSCNVFPSKPRRGSDRRCIEAFRTAIRICVGFGVTSEA